MNDQIQLAVALTVAAAPSGTPPPTFAAPPTSAEPALKGIFCEYRFCIAHPDDMAFYDVVAKQNPGSAASSNYSGGILAANNARLFIQLIWQDANTGTDPHAALDLVIDDRVDSRQSVEAIRANGLDAVFVPLSSTATAVLPYGGAAAWICHTRVFAWKAYAATPEVPKGLLLQALQAFRCEP
jgi:hypothetical protein